MTITKYGHSCLHIEIDGVNILTDPGAYSTIPETVKDVDAVLITHEHGDHIDLETLQAVLARSPKATVYTNASVGKLLEENNIAFHAISHGESVEVKGVIIEAIGSQHGEMHPEWPIAENTGFFIAGKLFFPGDALTNPEGPVQILALPVAGPWLKLSEAIDYAKKIQPSVCFPVHDGILKSPGSVHTIPPQILGPLGINFQILEEGVATQL